MSEPKKTEERPQRITYVNTFTDLLCWLIGMIVAFRVGGDLPLLLKLIGGFIFGEVLSMFWDNLIHDFANSQLFKDLTDMFGYGEDDE